MSDIALVHLVWKPAGPGPLQEFLRTYRQYEAGVEHELVVLYNGFSETDELRPFRELLADIPHRELRTQRPVQDIEAYVWVAQRMESVYLCFLNSYSELLASSWLRFLYENVSHSGVGAVGATGSWESPYSHFVSELQMIRRRWFVEEWVRNLKRQREMAEFRARFDTYPNPHLRTNAFLIGRGLWLSIQTESVRTKWDAWAFESGRQSLTRRLLARGLEVLVIGRDGAAYSKEKWPESGTFRRGDQRNLLVADNRTREYAAAGDEEKRYLAQLAWGDS